MSLCWCCRRRQLLLPLPLDVKDVAVAGEPRAAVRGADKVAQVDGVDDLNGGV